MINNVRTLLLNKVPTADSVLGEEYIPENFSPVRLYGELARIHNALIPERVSREEANMRVAAFMKLLHTPDLEPYVLKQDSRITYDPASTLFADKLADGSFSSSFNLTAVYRQLRSVLFDGDAMTALFADGGPDIDMFRALYLTGDSTAYKLSGALLALAYRMEDIYNG